MSPSDSSESTRELSVSTAIFMFIGPVVWGLNSLMLNILQLSLCDETVIAGQELAKSATTVTSGVMVIFLCAMIIHAPNLTKMSTDNNPQTQRFAATANMLFRGVTGLSVLGIIGNLTSASFVQACGSLM